MIWIISKDIVGGAGQLDYISVAMLVLCSIFKI